MSAVAIERVAGVQLGWGESLQWDERLQRLYFVDCATRELAWLGDREGANPGRITLPSMPTALYLTGDPDRLLAQLDDGLYAVLPSRGEAALEIPSPPGEIRFNDGVADPEGGVITGSLLLGLPGEPASGSYWRLSPDRGWRRLLEGKGNTNGPCFTPDGRGFYVADTTAALIYRFDYDPAAGLSGETVFADTRPLGGLPDGAILDAEGRLWSAIVGGSRVAQYEPDGRLRQVIELPATHPTSVAFGGPNLDVLYVTTISVRIPGVEPAGELSGALLRIEGLEVKGRAASRCRL